MDNVPLESPLDKFCYEMDRQLLGKTVFDYYDFVETINPTSMANLVFENAKFNFRYQLNHIIEILGRQGSGKSLFAQYLALGLGNIYGLPFDIENNTLADFDTLDMALHNSPYASTFIVDEQPKTVYGFGSQRLMNSLRDYEETCRYTMKNIIYVAPSEREHTSYYTFKSEDGRPSVERLCNPNCVVCSKKNQCLDYHKFPTPLCGITPQERHGYPVAFNFMLVTPRRIDNTFFPRGFVRLPVISPELYDRYDIVKRKNVELFEQKKAMGWNFQEKILDEFKQTYFEKIVKNGKVAGKSTIKALLIRFFEGSRVKFTTGELDVMASLISFDIKDPDFAAKMQKDLIANTDAFRKE